WLTWLDKESPAGLVEEAIKMDAGIRKAEEKMGDISRDKEALRAYQMREMALSDWTSGLNHAREEGVREGIEKGMEKGIEKGMRKGIQEGKQEGKQEVARNLKKIGIPVEQIARGTGLSIEEIAKL
ncbi:MAG: Rpn family recombination-promoting nuclease/putative transposase, partial [Treponema sp.]|nr:Rpn family recombination-promoting nuclease/putative transposase [Treponema sp.]